MNLAGISAEFRENKRSVVARGEVDFLEIYVLADNVALFLGKPAGGAVPYASAVKCFKLIVQAVCVVLPPTLVEYRVIYDRGMIVKCLYGLYFTSFFDRLQAKSPNFPNFGSLRICFQSMNIFW